MSSAVKMVVKWQFLSGTPAPKKNSGSATQCIAFSKQYLGWPGISAFFGFTDVTFICKPEEGWYGQPKYMF